MTYEALNLRRRYIWSAASRERDGVFWAGQKGREFRWIWPLTHRGAYRPRKHATQTWGAGGRYFRTDHWRLHDPDVRILASRAGGGGPRP